MKDLIPAQWCLLLVYLTPLTSFAQITMPYHLPHAVVTEDGVELALIEILSEEGLHLQGDSVLLVHGFQSNWHSFTLLAEAYRDRGYRVFLGTLRGHSPNGSLPDEQLSFEHLFSFDLPAMIHHVFEISGQSPIVFQGHSMGGMLLHIALSGLHLSKDFSTLKLSEDRARELESKIRLFVPTASPLSMSMNLDPSFEGLEQVVRNWNEIDQHHHQWTQLDPTGVLHRWRRFHQNIQYHVLRDWLPKLNKGIIHLPSLTVEEYQHLADRWPTRVAPALLKAVEKMRKSGYKSSIEDFDYTQISWREHPNAYATQVPTLLVSGVLDGVAPIDEQREFAKRQNLPHLSLDASHLDILASKEIVESIAETVHGELVNQVQRQAVLNESENLRIGPEPSTKNSLSTMTRGLIQFCQQLLQRF